MDVIVRKAQGQAEAAVAWHELWQHTTFKGVDRKVEIFYRTILTTIPKFGVNLGIVARIVVFPVNVAKDI